MYSGGGEPLLYEHFFNVLNYTLELKIKPLVVTNGTLITKKIAKEFFDKNVALVVKLNSFKPQVQNFLAGNNKAFELIQNGWKNLFEAGYGGPNTPPIAAETVVCKQNYEDMEELFIWCREHNVAPFIEILTVQGRAIFNDVNITSEQGKQSFERLLKIDQERYGNNWDPVGKMVAGFHCDRHYYSIYINSEGYVLPCAGVEVFVGNIKYQPLKQILSESPIIKTMRNIDKNIKGHCKTCKYHEKCYGCRGTAYWTLGDMLASDPFCWVNPERVI